MTKSAEGLPPALRLSVLLALGTGCDILRMARPEHAHYVPGQGNLNDKRLRFDRLAVRLG